MERFLQHRQLDHKQVVAICEYHSVYPHLLGECDPFQNSLVSNV